MKDFYCHIDRFCGDGLPNIMGNPVTSHTFMDRFYFYSEPVDSEGVPRASFDAARPIQIMGTTHNFDPYNVLYIYGFIYVDIYFILNGAGIFFLKNDPY